jgi:uroporphyrinogen-III synthase
MTPGLVLVSSPGALEGVDRELRGHRVRLTRIDGLVLRPVPRGRWLPTLPPAADVDAVVASSPAGVRFGVLPWYTAQPSRAETQVEFWAGGPETARQMRRALRTGVRQTRGEGADAILAAFPSARRKRILYFRSREAGGELAGALARRGHRVWDVVAYRLEDPPPLNAPSRRALGACDVLIVSSPSVLSSLRRRLTERTFRSLRERATLVVLGDRSLRSARGHGFRRVRVIAPSSAQRFTRALLGVVRNARA